MTESRKKYEYRIPKVSNKIMSFTKYLYSFFRLLLFQVGLVWFCFVCFKTRYLFKISIHFHPLRASSLVGRRYSYSPNLPIAVCALWIGRQCSTKHGETCRNSCLHIFVRTNNKFDYHYYYFSCVAEIEREQRQRPIFRIRSVSKHTLVIDWSVCHILLVHNFWQFVIWTQNAEANFRTGTHNCAFQNYHHIICEMTKDQRLVRMSGLKVYEQMR